jgi:hypothetical protein
MINNRYRQNILELYIYIYYSYYSLQSTTNTIPQFCASSDKAAILNLDFNLYDKIISFTVLHILQIQMFYNLLLRQVCSLGPFNTRCEV